MAHSNERKMGYEWVPPDGGWGYAVTLALSFMMTSTVVPISSFALIFGNYLATFTDETYATAIVSSLFGTMLHITGLLSHFVLKRFSFRLVGIIGSFLYFTGSFGSVFATDLHYIILTYSIIQGLGVGLIMPSALSAVNSYFDDKKTVMHGAAQAFLTCVNISFPLFTRILLDEYGFRGTQAIFAAISLHALLGAVMLQPVKKHMKKVKEIENSRGHHSYDQLSTESAGEVSYKPANVDGEELLYKVVDLKSTLQPNKLSKSLISVASFGSMIFPVSIKRNEGNYIRSIFNILDINLLKDVFYLNMAFGMAICTMSEMNFMAILPLFLFDIGFSKRDVTVVMTVYFASDLVMRITFIIFAALFQFSPRKVFFWNAVLSFLIRIAFFASDSFWWVTTTTAILGFSRCLIQTPMPVVIAERYSDNFSSALSFYMVVTGVTSIALGAIMGIVRTKTQSSAMVFHVLTVCFLFCVIPWTIEMIYKRIKKREVQKERIID